MNTIKIKMYGKHFCNVPRNLLCEFEKSAGIINVSAWIKEQVFKDFGIKLLSANDILNFADVLELNYYMNIGEWVREKMRLSIKESIANVESIQIQNVSVIPK